MSVNTVSTFLAIGTVVLGAFLVTAAVVGVASLVSDRAAGAVVAMRRSVEGLGLRLAWAMALVATAGSLYFSEIAGFTPCEFCWYQRIAMYPLVVVLGIAVARRDETVRRYVMPLAVIGGLVAAYHYTIQHFPDLDVGSCDVFAPCSAAWVWKFGFVSIPLMALVSFGVIVAALVLDRPSPSALADESPMSQGAMSHDEEET